MKTVRSIADVVGWRMCVGCGACAYICPKKNIDLFDFLDEGIRPVMKAGDCAGCTDCLNVCPSVKSGFSVLKADDKQDRAFFQEWGPVVEMWEGHAANGDIRYKGSSGGVLTALSAYCLEKLGMYGVLHIGASPDDPLRNRTRLSRCRNDLVEATGSRYSPASVCNGLGLIEAAPSPCAVIGKPSEIAAVQNARQLRPELDSKVGVTMSFFCAESPSTRGTIALLERMGLNPSDVTSLRYRGLGWPGHFAPVLRGSGGPEKRITYRESWSFLQSFRPWSVQLWPDGTGELADITCGDPWYVTPDGTNQGASLIVARTQRGREIIEGAAKAGYIQIQNAENWKLARSQSNLLDKKGATWGRRQALRMFGLPVTQFDGLALFHCWRRLSLLDRCRSIFGTIRRIVSRKLFRRVHLDSRSAVPVQTAFECGTDSCAPRT